MAVSEIYGVPSSWYTIPRSFDKIKIANFTNNAASLNNARVALAMQAGNIQPGTLLDSSVCTHAIPATLSGHEWNTMFDVGGINVKGGPDNCILNKHFGSSPGIIYRVNSRSSGSSDTSLAPYLNNPQSYNSPQTNVSDNWDIYRMCPVTQIDFKRFVFAILLQVCTEFETELDSEGIKRVTSSTSAPNNILIDLQTWISDMRYSSTETFHEHYPHICSIHLVPLWQMYGNNEVWNNFTSWLNDDHRFACIPNMNFDYTCSGWNQSASRCTAANTGTVVQSNCVNWMDNLPISGTSVRYMMNESQTNTMFLGDFPCTLFTIFGMNGGNGTSPAIVSNCSIDSNNNRYQVRTVRGFSHLDWGYIGSESSSSRQLFAWWRDQPVYPAPADPKNPTPTEQLAINAWKALISSHIHHMVSYTGAVFQDSVNGYNLNPAERYIGVIDERGYATGEFEIITEDTLSDYIQTASDNFVDDTPYDPASETDPNEYSDTMRSGDPPNVKSCNKYYAIDGDNVGILYSALTQTLDGVPTGEKEEYLLSHFLTTSPGDLIVSLRWYPFDFYDIFFESYDVPKIIFVGDLPLSYKSTNVVGYKARTGTSFSITVNIGSFKMFRKWGDFRDYSPYTACTIYTPFCTPVKLDLSVCMDHNIYVQMCIDLLTGACTAVIRLDSTEGIIVGTSSGSCGVDLPVSSLDQATYNNATFTAIQQSKSANKQLASQYIGAVTNGVMTAATAGAGKVPKPAQAVQAGSSGVSGVMGVLRAWDTKIAADYNLSHIPEHYKEISAVTSTLSMLLPLNSYAIIERPQMLPGDHSQYGHTVGYATLYNGRLSDLSGYTICQTADLSGFAAPSSVKDMIYQALRSGVYV